MRHRLLLSGVLMTALLACGWLGADEAKPSARRSGMPTGWSKLSLTTDQKAKIANIHKEYQSKMEALQKQMRDLQKQEHREMVTVLTDAQKAKLKEMVATKSGIEGEEAPSPTKAAAKPKPTKGDNK